MEILNLILAFVENNKHTKSASLMARAGLSACNSRYTCPSMSDLSHTLDYANQDLMRRLVALSSEPDYSNATESKFMSAIFDIYPEFHPDVYDGFDLLKNHEALLKRYRILKKISA